MKPVPHGESYAGKLHVRFDEGAGVPDNKGRSALLYTLLPPATLMGHTFAGGYTLDWLAVFWIGVAALSVVFTLAAGRSKNRKG
ncbi:MAG: hypothetical protein K6F50_00560 [Kiritimatiellae bacterium]|nr:hypothetical protein [Kiritimatiellia bacterium]